MYHINTEKDIPNTEKLYKTMSDKMRTTGIKIGDYKPVLEVYEAKAQYYYSIIQSEYHIDNPNSPKQIVGYLQNLSDRVAPGQRNEVMEACCNWKGVWTSNADALETLQNAGYQFASDVLKYREYSGVVKGIKTLVKSMDENGNVHPQITLGITNRLQFNTPPIMSIHKKLLWSLVVPHTDEYEIYSVDIKNQEPGIMINLLGLDELKPYLRSSEGLYECIFKQALRPVTYLNIEKTGRNHLWDNGDLMGYGVSPDLYCPLAPDSSSLSYGGKKVVEIQQFYCETQTDNTVELPSKVKIMTIDKEIYEVDVEWLLDDSKDAKGKLKYKDGICKVVGNLIGLDLGISEKERSEFKRSWVSFSYGGSSGLIIKTCKHLNGDRVYKYLNSLNGLKNYKELCGKASKNGQRAMRTAFGTVVSTTETNPKVLRRVLMDLPIQGTGADILALLVEHFYSEIERRNLTGMAEIYFTRHDELVIEVKKDLQNMIGVDGVKGMLTDILEHKVNDWEPFKVEVEHVDAEVISEKLAELLAEDVREDYN